MSLDVGDRLPNLTVAASGGKTITLSEYAKRPLVVYFYPKDNTPGCTQEGQDFRDLYPEFQAMGCHILGVSKDSVKSHDNFAAKFDFPFLLLSDPDEAVCKSFDVIKEKSMYGKTYLGVDRSTFLFDRTGTLRQIWRSVKVKGHAQAVLDAVKAL